MQVTAIVVVLGGGSVQDWLSLYNSGWPGNHYVDPLSPPHLLESKECVTTHPPLLLFLIRWHYMFQICGYLNLLF